MKKFLAVYIGTVEGFENSPWSKSDPGTRQKLEAAGMKAWGNWGQANQAAIVDQGTPLGKTKRVSKTGIADIRNALTAYTIVQAESHEAAAKIFEGHPHFSIFPGEAVEIMECLPIPGQ